MDSLQIVKNDEIAQKAKGLNKRQLECLSFDSLTIANMQNNELKSEVITSLMNLFKIVNQSSRDVDSIADVLSKKLSADYSKWKIHEIKKAIELYSFGELPMTENELNYINTKNIIQAINVYSETIRSKAIKEKARILEELADKDSEEAKEKKHNDFLKSIIDCFNNAKEFTVGERWAFYNFLRRSATNHDFFTKLNLKVTEKASSEYAHNLAKKGLILYTLENYIYSFALDEMFVYFRSKNKILTIENNKIVSKDA